MKVSRGFRLGVLACVIFFAGRLSAQPLLIYQTGFEASEGYNTGFELAGQKGWLSDGTGGNGLKTEAFPGFGQQAFIGQFPPTDTGEFTSLWRPLEPPLIPTNRPIVHFSVLMQILPSANGHPDDFRWSVYDTRASNLFAVNFSTSDQAIFTVENGQFLFTGSHFAHDGYYLFEIWMNLRRHLWTGVLNDVVIANARPVSQSGAALALGDIDAVWNVRNPATPGDNLMLFDNYRLVSEDLNSIPARLEAVGVSADGSFTLRIFGEPGLTYQIQVTENFLDWFALGDFVAPEGGVFDFEDPSAKDARQSFYQVVPVP